MVVVIIVIVLIPAATTTDPKFAPSRQVWGTIRKWYRLPNGNRHIDEFHQRYVGNVRL